MQKKYGKHVALRMLVTVGSRDTFIKYDDYFISTMYYKVKHMST